MVFGTLFLGDPGVGKSSLIRALASPHREEAGGGWDSSYSPSVGPECCEVNGDEARDATLALWDYPGNERLMTARGGGAPYRRHLLSCVLVYDATSMRSVDHLAAWYDEFVQFAFDARHGVLPAVCLVGTKIDLNAATTDDDIAAAAKAFAARLVLHAPPPIHAHQVLPILLQGGVFRVSAQSMEGVKELHRFLFKELLPLLQRRHDASTDAVRWLCRWPAPPPPLTLDLLEDDSPTTSYPVVRAFITSLVEPYPSSLSAASPSAALAGYHHTGHGLVNAIITNNAPDPLYPFAADVCVLVMRLRFASIAASQILSWSTKMFQDSHLLRPEESLTLVVCALPSSADYTDATRLAALRACEECGATFIILNHDQDTAPLLLTPPWEEIAKATVEKRRATLVVRSLWETDQPTPTVASRPRQKKNNIHPSESPSTTTAGVRQQTSAAVAVANPKDPALLLSLEAINRRIIDAELSCERRVAMVKAELDAERHARERDATEAAARERHLQDQIDDFKIELRLVWQTIDEERRGTAGTTQAAVDDAS